MTSVWDIVGSNSTAFYAKGFDETADDTLLKEAVEAAKRADKAVIFAGLTDVFESEGYDRSKLDMPEFQNQLIFEVAKVQPNTIVVLHNGSPIVMPWLDCVKGVLEMYLGGEAVGSAAAKLLYGEANPCGRLAETFPLRLIDTPTYPYFGVEREDVPYREGCLVGYRYYQTLQKEVLFPFGHGLSYTSFAYSNLKVSKMKMTDEEEVEVQVDVTNKGTMLGKEVVQIYVAGGRQDKVRPIRQLRAFRKVELNPGETKTVEFILGKRAFAEWNTEIHDWYVVSGDYQIQVGISAVEIVLQQTVSVISTRTLKPKFTINSPMGDMLTHPIACTVLKRALSAMLGERASNLDSEKGDESGALNKEAMQASKMATPLRSMLSFSTEAKKEQVEALIAEINSAVENA